MAKKIFRLHDDKETNESGWFESTGISKNDLDTIITTGKGVATSIPSPFARIDLVKSAFKWVANNDIDGQTAHHKLVSDALDVAQLFFLSQLYPEIKILEWNPKERLRELKRSKNHDEFAETLETYWTQDGAVYNFDHTDSLFFILYNEKLVGGTSPATLFFAAPDANAEDLNMNINRGTDKLLDDIYASLAQREWTFVEYIFALSKSKQFKEHFTSAAFNEFDEYLTKVLKSLSSEKQVIIAQLDKNSLDKYKQCHVSDSQANYCNILGIPLGLQIPGKIESDFVIKSDLSDEKPMVLPFDKFSDKWNYTSMDVKWDGEKMYKKVPYKNTKSKEESRLPILNDRHYWLSAGNFLEDKIIELPYTVNATKFDTCGADKYLLPLTPTFFKYFKAKKASQYLTLEKLSSGIQAKLTIPVKGGNIHFKKIYNQEDIEILKVHLAIMPFLKTKKIDLDYTIGILDSRIKRMNDIQIAAFDKGIKLDLDLPVTRRPGDQKEIKSFYYKTSNNFDTLQIKLNNVKGCIIPKMKEFNGNDQVDFSIDFGTTNTHIEYKEEGSSEKAFNYTSDMPLWQSLISTSNKDPLSGIDDSFFESEMMPYQLNDTSEINFPLRTAIVYNHDIDFSENLDVFRHTNNFLLYEKRFKPRSFKVNTGLKWSNYAKQEDQILVESYIEYLMLMTLYKTLVLGGDPKKTKITWFYPVSMDRYELGVFSEAWLNSFKKVFKASSIKNIRKIPESIAPYLFYKAKHPGLSLSIDIGGGSSDIALFEKEENNPKLISSFKFAGNAIFGDGFSGEFKNSTDNNGFVNTFLKEANKAVHSINNVQKKLILDDIINSTKDSADFSSFLFSLENEKNIKFSYTNLLRKDRNMKLSILVFFGAIAFYAAKLLKKSGQNKIPDNILFSGTASKSISIIDPSLDFENIANFFKYVFESINGTSSTKINIALEPQQKEITCKGVLKAGLDKELKSDSILYWIGAEGDNTWSEIYDKEKDTRFIPKYNEIDEEKVGNLIADSIQEFYKILDSYVQGVNLNSTYGIDPNGYDLFKKMRSENLKPYLKRGLVTFHKEKNKPIEETLFFYPLIGVLNSFAFKLSQTNNV